MKRKQILFLIGRQTVLDILRFELEEQEMNMKYTNKNNGGYDYE